MNKALVDATRHYCQRHASKGPLISTPVPGLILLRRTSPAAVDHAIVQPLLCLVLEGSKEVDIDQRTERYNAGDLMLVARNTPTLTRIAGASVAAPYMSIALDLNISVLSELIELHRGAPASPPQDTRAPLLDAMRRLISLLDDPTSLAALGTGLLREIHQLLHPETNGKTLVQALLIVSHRVTSMERADHILVLDEGRIVDQGTPPELIRQPGYYQEMWRLQNESPAPEPPELPQLVPAV